MLCGFHTIEESEVAEAQHSQHAMHRLSPWRDLGGHFGYTPLFHQVRTIWF